MVFYTMEKVISSSDKMVYLFTKINFNIQSYKQCPFKIKINYVFKKKEKEKFRPTAQSYKYHFESARFRSPFSFSSVKLPCSALDACN